MPKLAPFVSGIVTARSMPFWCVANRLADPFGEPVLPEISSVETCQLICEAAADGLIERTGFHDDDLVPWDPEHPEDDLDEKGQTYATLSQIRQMLQEAGVEVNTATCNLHGNKIFRQGGLTNPDPAVRALAWQKSRRTARIGHFLGAHHYTYWVARDGFEVPTVVSWKEVYPWIAEGLNGVRGYIKASGFTCYEDATIEYKHNEPRGVMYIPTSGDAVGFIASFLEDPSFWRVNPELLQHDAMGLMSSIRTAAFLTATGKLSFLHFGSQIKGEFDNDFSPLIGPEGLKETVYTFRVLQQVGWKGVVEDDCHMLRVDADPADPIGCRKKFIQDCSVALAIVLQLVDRIGKDTQYPARHADADLMATCNMCLLPWHMVKNLARKLPAGV